MSGLTQLLPRSAQQNYHYQSNHNMSKSRKNVSKVIDLVHSVGEVCSHAN